MPTQEERLSVLEQAVASLRQDFLQAIVENTRSMSTLNKVISQQEQNVRDANHEITILLGIASGQERDIKVIKNDLSIVKNDSSIVKEHVERINQRLEGLEKQSDQMLRLLTILTSKSDQET
jgi:septal ring factor EnvC (AmiA/AmiB activator)